jgi:hypothetical protein
MRHLILSAAIPALMLGACATTAPVAEAPAQHQGRDERSRNPCVT